MRHRGLRGDFTRSGLQGYLAVQTALFWGLIVLAWLGYPADHHFSIRTHTFSFLGSYNPEHNPRFWWLFSLTMVFWGLSEIPVVLHFHRSFAKCAPWLSAAGTGWLAVGCLGIMLVGIFPDVRDEWRAGLRYTQVHTWAALLVAVGFGSGFLLYVLALLKSVLQRAWTGTTRGFPHRRAAWPLLFWVAGTGTCLFMLWRWAHIYGRMKALAASTGRPIGSSWAEGLKTWYSFPLWENLAIYTLYVALVWLALAVARDDHDGA